MSEKYIVEGPSLAKLLQENRVRVARGELVFTPLTIGDDEKKPEVSDDKEVNPVADTKKPKRTSKK